MATLDLATTPPPAAAERATTRPTHPAPDTKIALAVLALLFLFYLLIMSGTGVSLPGFEYFQQARRLVGQGSLFFEVPLRWGEEYWKTSNLGIGMSTAYFPALLPLRFIRPDLFSATFFNTRIAYDSRYLLNDLYLYASWTNPMIAALTCMLLYLICRTMGLSTRWSVVAALVCGMASPLTPYAKYDFSQPLMGLTLVGTLWLILRGQVKGGIGNWIGAGLFLAYGIITRFELLLAIPLYGLIILSYPTLTLRPAWRKKLLPLLIFGATAALGIVVYLGVNWIRYGSPIDFGYGTAFDRHSGLIGLVGTFFAPARGLFVFFPLALLSFVGLAGQILKRSSVAIALGLIMGLYIFLYGVYWSGWFSGTAWGPRYMVPFIPFLTLFAVLWVAEKGFTLNWRSAAFAVLVGVGIIVVVNGVLFNFLAYYGRPGAPANDVVMGMEYFLLDASPLYNGWDFAHHWYRYDLFWLNRLRNTSSPIPSIALATLVLMLIGSAIYLARAVFMSKPSLSGEQATVGTSSL